MTTKERRDPRTAYPQPPFPEQSQEPPGTEADLQPQADHGERSYAGTGRLSRKAALITGGDSGIGRAIAIAFAREGADVAISYLGGAEEPDAAATLDHIREAGRRGLSLPGDIQDEATCQSVVERAHEEFGGLDILVNNAAWQDCGNSLAEVTTDEWRRIFRTNVEAMFHLARAAVPLMRAGGTIIEHGVDPGVQSLAELLPTRPRRARS